MKEKKIIIKNSTKKILIVNKERHIIVDINELLAAILNDKLVGLLRLNYFLLLIKVYCNVDSIFLVFSFYYNLF